MELVLDYARSSVLDLEARRLTLETVGGTTARTGAPLRPQPQDLNRLPGEPPPAPSYRTRAEVAPAAGDAVVPGTLWSVVTEVDQHLSEGYWTSESFFAAWPLLLPHHPDVVAAHLLPELGRAARARSQGTGALLALAESGRPAGPAIHAAVALALRGKDVETQASAVDALLALAARDHLDGTELGRRLAAMVRQGEVTVKRLSQPLEDAARAGAATEVWATLHELLTGLLTAEQPPSGMADILTCAAAVAELVPEALPIPALERLTTSTARSHQVIEAKRLAAILGPAG